MAYIGLDPNTPLLNTSTQLFSGNGAVTQYTLNRAVASASDLDVIVGNVAQRPGIDYVAGNTTIIFTTPPGAGSDNVVVTYRGGALNTLDLSASVFQAGAVGAPSVYSLASNNAGIYWASANTMGIVVTGANRALFNANATSVNSVTGAIVTPGGIGVGGNIHIGNQATINGGVESTSVSTGTLRVTGGAGITGNLNIGGDITCVGDFTVNGTFTTTGTDSLEVNDPFIFLANANPGDTYDSGVISEYFDGTNTRYTGYFRDITDNTFKFFGNLLPKPGTTVDTANTSYRAANVTVGNLSATGNVTATYFVGNGAALTGISTDTTQIQNGNSRISIPSINGNIVNNVNGVTIANVWSNGISVVGAVAVSTTLSATGNITGGNVDTAGQITATGNITSAANVSGGNVLTGGRVSATGNVVGGNVTTAGLISATGNVTGGNIRTAGLMSATGDIFGNNFSAATGISAATTIAAGTDITAGATISSVGSISSSAAISATGNITGGNVLTSTVTTVSGTLTLRSNTPGGNIDLIPSSGLVKVTSTVQTVDLSATGAVVATGNITGGNLITGALLQASTLSVTGAATFSTATAEIGIGNSMTSGVIYIGGPSQTGLLQFGQSTATQTVNVATGATSSANTKTINFGTNGAANSQTNINIGTNLGNATVQYTANTMVALANTGGSALSVAGNITGGNLRTAGQVSATANVSGGNVISAGLVNAGTTVSAAGNITGGNIITGGAVSAVGVISATANVTGGNIITGGAVSATGNVSATANVLGGNVISSALVQGVTVSASGNVIGGNVTTAGLISATGNITGGNILGGANVNATTHTGTTVSVTGNITGGNILGGANVNATIHTGTTVSVTGNITGGNISTAGNLAAPTAAVNTNTTQVATTAYVLGQLSSSTPAAIAAAGAVGTGTTFARADHTHSGVTSITGTANQVTASASAGAVTLSLPQSIATSSAVQFGSLTVTTGNITLGNVINGGANLSGNIGSATGYFNTVFAKATSAQYADLAETYRADAEYPPGTVLSFGGDFEVTLTTGQNCARVAGVVSTNPAHVMNAGLESEHSAVLALTGRVPTSVVGTVRKGDMMVSAGNGQAMSCATPAMGTVIGKALENHFGASGVIEIVVGRM